MRQPKELSDNELKLIAFKVRTRLEAKWGRAAIVHLFQGRVAVDLLEQTYIAVREQLELE